MAFCKYCGNKLQEGELCNCERATAAREAQKSSVKMSAIQSKAEAKEDAANSVSSNHTNSLIEQFTKIWKEPADEGRAFIKSQNSRYAVYFILIQAFLTGVILIAQMGNLQAKVGVPLVSELIIGYFLILLVVFIGSLLVSGIYIIVFWAGFRVVKATESIKSVVCLIAMRSIAAIPFNLAAIVVSMISQPWGVLVNLIPGIVSLVFMIRGFNGFESISENKKVHFTWIIILVTIVVMILIPCLILGISISNAVSEIIEMLV